MSNFGHFQQKPVFAPIIKSHGQKMPKNNSKLDLEHFLVIFVDNGGKNRFLSKLPKNGHFPLNKVSKITNNQKNSKNRKCSEYMIFT